MSSRKSCCVIGTGFLGIRIAGELSRLGLTVNVYDSDLEKLRKVPNILHHQQKELLARRLCHSAQNLQVNICETLLEAVENADFIFEAVVENLDIKRWLFQKLTNFCPSYAIICSNTLNLDLNQMTEEALFKQRIIGCRFFLPVYAIPIVEMMTATSTSVETVEALTSFFESIGYEVLRRGNQPKVIHEADIRRYWKESKHKIQSSVNSTNQQRESSVCWSIHGEQQCNSDCESQKYESCTDDDTVESIVSLHNDRTLSSLSDDIRDQLHDGGKKQQADSTLRCCGASMNVAITKHNRETKSGHCTQTETPTVANEERCIGQRVMQTETGHHTLTESPTAVNVDRSISEVVDVHNKETEAGHVSMLERDGEDSQSECVVCNERFIDTVLMPCAHMWLCHGCALILKNADKTCPACRHPIQSIIRVFKP